MADTASAHGPAPDDLKNQRPTRRHGPTAPVARWVSLFLVQRSSNDSPLPAQLRRRAILHALVLRGAVVMKRLGDWLRALEIALGVLAIFCWLAATAWLRHLTAPDEGRYVGVALEMLRTGDWVVPRLDGMPFFHKPPLFYWIGASAMSVFGVSEWAARLPSLLGATAATTALWLFLRRWDSAPAARVAAGVLVTMPFLYIGAQFANLDMLVAGCITVTLLLAAHAALAREAGEPWRMPLAFAFASAALGMLAKGLIGLLLPGVIFIGWVLAAGKARRFGLLAWWPGWLLFVVIALPW
ncbi:MAG: glycosyltransferase family 39 protein, partial [Variovorax sp.]